MPYAICQPGIRLLSAGCGLITEPFKMPYELLAYPGLPQQQAGQESSLPHHTNLAGNQRFHVQRQVCTTTVYGKLPSIRLSTLNLIFGVVGCASFLNACAMLQAATHRYHSMRGANGCCLKGPMAPPGRQPCFSGGAGAANQ
jgi:hypothetical protein